MQVLKGRHYLGRVEDGSGVVKTFCSSQVGEEFSARDVVKQHVQEAVVMVRPLAAGRAIGVWSEV